MDVIEKVKQSVRRGSPNGVAQMAQLIVAEGESWVAAGYYASSVDAIGNGHGLKL